MVACVPYYILLSNLTDEGWKTIREKPERIKEVNKELEGFGVRVISQYAVLGPYDFANVVEAPDNKTIGRVSIELGSRGTIKITSMAAIPIDEFIASMKKSWNTFNLLFSMSIGLQAGVNGFPANPSWATRLNLLIWDLGDCDVSQPVSIIKAT